MSFSKSPPVSPTLQAAARSRSRSPPLTPLPSLSTRLPGLTAFDRAVHVVNISNTTSQAYTVGQSQSTGGGDDERVDFSPEEQLLLYGAYKQATSGDVKGLKPTFFDISARSKWQAWANMRGKTQDQAKDVYVDLVVKFLTKPGSLPDHHQLADEIVQRPSSPQLISSTSISTSSPSTVSSNLDKDLPPIQIHPTSSSTATASTPSSYATVAATATSSLNNSPYQHQQRVRKGSISHSIRSVATGVHSAAASVYELANESFVDTEIEDHSAVGSTVNSIRNNNNNNNSNADPEYHKVTETIVEEKILNDDEYAAEVELVRSAVSSRPTSVPSSPTRFNAIEQQYSQPEAEGSPEVYVDDKVDEEVDEEEEEAEDDEVYQSSVEYDEDESDKSSISGSIHESITTTTTTLQDTYSHIKVAVLETESDQTRPGRRNDKDDFVDEGVFDEEEKDELEMEAQQESLLGSPTPVSEIVADLSEEHAHSTTRHRLSRDGSVSSGYGGSVLSDKENAPARALDMALLGQESILPASKGLESPPVEPYRVHAVFDTNISPLGLRDQEKDEERVATLSKDVTSNGTHPLTTTATGTGSANQELVCPVSKKSSASGAVCPAAMFAQARAAAAADASGNASSTTVSSTEPLTNTVQSTHSSPGPITDKGDQATSASNSTTSPRALTAPASAPASSSSASSAVTTATNQGMRIGQGIVSRFSALRNSLAAASARAASSALSGSSSSSTSSSNNPNAVVVKDPVTQQSVTVICPHIASTQVLETEVMRLQTDISVLHERLDMLQESLKITSQTRALERRSARGILKMVLRQGLINAVLLLIVFAVLYKRKSPIAFAVLAYIGQGRKEGEAGWRALMRWFAGLVQVGQRNQKYIL
ncbi:hypothetical protein BG011_008934, partial [Mortierella polycephala]